MADNYLERQYESYEARKATWEREKKLGKKRAHHPQKPLPAQEEHVESDEQEMPVLNDETHYEDN